MLESVKKDVIRMLAEKKIDLSLYSTSEAHTSRQPLEDLPENEQNVRNRLLEVTYLGDIQQWVHLPPGFVHQYALKESQVPS